jgi:hypothetical protein
MRTMLVVLMSVCLISVISFAGEKVDHGPAGYVPLAELGSQAVGDDCTNPIVITLPADMPYVDTNTTCGRGNSYDATCLGGYDGGEDIIYRLDVTSAVTIGISMTSDTAWRGLSIGTGCPNGDPCLDFVTSYTSGPLSLGPLDLTVGSYYIMADTYPSPDCIPNFTLTIGTPPEPPVNDTCDGAIDLQTQSLQSFEVDLCSYNNHYDPMDEFGESCTNYGAEGPEAVYMVALGAGETFDACVAASSGSPYGVDCSLYLITDCGDSAASCVAGDDSGDPECISYTPDVAGTFYLVVDTFSDCGEGLVTVSISQPVAIEESSWGSVKSLYR